MFPKSLPDAAFDRNQQGTCSFFAVVKYLFTYIFIFREYPKLDKAASPWNSYWPNNSTANSLGAKAIETTVVAGGQVDLWKHLGLVNCTCLHAVIKFTCLETSLTLLQKVYQSISCILT